ncbi:MAG: carboxypeptidase regulatory-like domain-containing protein, partial [Bryobacterales bacterium]|nr:carboxypeptidase regulatory-like domain-containing protein [Bryobacterales bacterium]
MRWNIPCLAVVLAGVLYSQSYGTITGVIKDTSGSILPGAALVVTDENTGIKMSILSQPDGGYRAPQLIPGTYSLSVELAGFKKLTLSGVKLDVGTTLSQDLTMELGAVTESVTVTGQQNLVEASSGEVGTTVSISHVQEMALADRNVYRLVNLVPGAFVSTASGQAAGTPVFVGGSRGWSVANTVDGVNNTRAGLGIGNVEMSPPLDSMQEFRVQLSSYSAQSGRSSNGQITAVTRSGTNRFHGSLYEYLRNDKFDAAGWGNDSKPALRRNNYGGTLGGPIIRNRTFFFVNFDGLRQHQGTSVTRNVGLPEWKTGDFSKLTRQQGNAAAVQVLYDPATGSGTFAAPVNSSPFPGNVIPSSRLDPVALKAVQVIPGPNRRPDNPFTQAGNWQLPNMTQNTRDFYIGRVDHELNGKTKVYFRYIFAAPDKTGTPPLQGWGDADPSQTSVLDRHQNASLNLTHLFSPTLFVTTTIGFNRTRPANISGAPGKTDYAKLLGLPNAPAFGFPLLNYAGGAVTVSALGFARAERFAAFTNTDYLVNFTKIRGDHTLLFGAQYTRYNGNVRIRPSAGTYNFTGRFTQGYTAAGTAIANTGMNFADFLLGRLSSVSAESIPSIGK